MKDIAELNIIQKVDNYISKENKTYFLLKKIKDYEKRLHHQGKWSIYTLKKYERKWQDISRKYNQFYIYGIEFVGIGETIPRLFMYLSDKKKRTKNDAHIVLPTFFKYYTSGVVNKKIFDIFGKYVHFITGENIDFWKYVTLFHSNKLNTRYFDMYNRRDVAYTFNIEVGKPLLSFTDEIEIYAKKKMRQMGIKGKYICIHAREVATKTKNFFAAYADTSVIDADINTYGKACAYMSKLGYQAVRLGKDESRKCEIEGVVDYANNFYDELMDFYLIANCRFIIGGMAGIVAIASFWGRPILQVNTLSFCYGQEALPRTKYDLYIPKKFYSKRKKRFLNLYEMWDVSYRCDRYNGYFVKEQIEVIDNTEEEILNATIEMDKKLSNMWVETDEERKAMQKYWEIITLWKSKHELTYLSRQNGGKGCDMIHRAICYSYLKDNLYLLDLKE